MITEPMLAIHTTNAAVMTIEVHTRAQLTVGEPRRDRPRTVSRAARHGERFGVGLPCGLATLPIAMRAVSPGSAWHAGRNRSTEAWTPTLHLGPRRCGSRSPPRRSR